MFKNKYSFWFVILFLVIFTRLEIFIQPVGTDEGIFFHIAQEISKGHLLYHDVADHKQPLVFYWFAIIFKLFGHNVFIQRLVESLLCLGMVGFILKIGQRLFKSIKTSQIVSILFIVGINAHRIAQGGNHLEFYVAFFTLAALAVYFGKYGLSKKIRYLFLVGFLFGMGFLSKTVALFSFLGFCVGFMFIEKKFIKKLLILGTGFVLPLIFLCSIYYIQGNINNYIDVVYLKNISYTVSNLNWMRFITHFSEMIVDQILSLSFMWFALIKQLPIAHNNNVYGSRLYIYFPVLGL